MVYYLVRGHGMEFGNDIAYLEYDSNTGRQRAIRVDGVCIEDKPASKYALGFVLGGSWVGVSMDEAMSRLNGHSKCPTCGRWQR